MKEDKSEIFNSKYKLYFFGVITTSITIFKTNLSGPFLSSGDSVKNYEENDSMRQLSPKSRRRAQNRIYCRQNRRKKKEYVHELENKIEHLEKQITNLSSQIDKYKYKLNIAAIGEERDFGEYNELQEYRRQTTIKSLEEGKDEKELKKNIADFAKFAGLASSDRQKLIKAAIRVVIDN
jgi:predicted RNase H-like nuclease (RuvC/YqgF family)